jgi:hypothetical protein
MPTPQHQPSGAFPSLPARNGLIPDGHGVGNDLSLTYVYYDKDHVKVNRVDE